MTSNTERMAVNAALEKIIARIDENREAARRVVKYGSGLKESKRIQMKYRSRTRSSGEDVSGYSPGQGEVTIKDAERQEEKEWEGGVNKDRIGHFRLWKEEEGELRFHHFWKSGITTRSIGGERPDEYCLGYDPVSLEPTYLGLNREKLVFTLWLGIWMDISRFYLEAIYGKVPKKVVINIQLHN
ncbi:MAG: hypothetical protein WDN10_01840 [bacterium]